MHDYPYRLEAIDHVRHTPPFYEIVLSGQGTVCSGENYMEMRRLVEAANEMAAIDHGDRGR